MLTCFECLIVRNFRVKKKSVSPLPRSGQQTAILMEEYIEYKDTHEKTMKKKKQHKYKNNDTCFVRFQFRAICHFHWKHIQNAVTSLRFIFIFQIRKTVTSNCNKTTQSTRFSTQCVYLCFGMSNVAMKRIARERLHLSFFVSYILVLWVFSMSTEAKIECSTNEKQRKVGAPYR